MQAINQNFARVEMTCNFVMDRELSDAHTLAMLDLVRGSIHQTRAQGERLPVPSEVRESFQGSFI